MNDFRAELLRSVLAVFTKQKKLGERAMAQLSDDDLFATLDTESNSIAVIVKHLRGNMRSRWTDFLTADGEKPDRDRDQEFIPPAERSRAEVMRWWEEGWRSLFDALGALRPGDLEATVHIRGEPLTATAAILRQVDHYAQHVGQIVLLAKHHRGADWQTLSIARGMSAEYLRRG